MDEWICFKLGMAKVLLNCNQTAKFHLFIFKNDSFYNFKKPSIFKKNPKTQWMNRTASNVARLKSFLRDTMVPSFISLSLKMTFFKKNSNFKNIPKNQRMNGYSSNLTLLKCFLRAIIVPSVIPLTLEMMEI